MRKVEKTDAEWREQLDPEAYRILRQAGTERPFSGEYHQVPFRLRMARVLCSLKRGSC
jgi:peptide methionine sulfoxide reductase MsrB